MFAKNLNDNACFLDKRGAMSSSQRSLCLQRTLTYRHRGLPATWPHQEHRIPSGKSPSKALGTAAWPNASKLARHRVKNCFSPAFVDQIHSQRYKAMALSKQTPPSAKSKAAQMPQTDLSPAHPGTSTHMPALPSDTGQSPLAPCPGATSIPVQTPAATARPSTS